MAGTLWGAFCARGVDGSSPPPALSAAEKPRRRRMRSPTPALSPRNPCGLVGGLTNRIRSPATLPEVCPQDLIREARLKIPAARSSLFHYAYKSVARRWAGLFKEGVNIPIINSKINTDMDRNNVRGNGNHDSIVFCVIEATTLPPAEEIFCVYSVGSLTPSSWFECRNSCCEEKKLKKTKRWLVQFMKHY